LVTSTAV